MTPHAPEPASRGLPWIALVVTLAVASTLLLLNLDGYHNHVGGDLNAAPPTYHWAHGWPRYWLIRKGTGYKTINAVGQVTYFGSPRPTSRWPLDPSPIVWFGLTPLLINFIVMIMLPVGAGYGAGMLLDRYPLGNHFGVKSLLFAVLLCGVILQFGTASVQAVGTRIAAYFMAMSIITVACFLTVYGAARLMIPTVRGILRRLRPSDSAHSSSAAG